MSKWERWLALGVTLLVAATVLLGIKYLPDKPGSTGATLNITSTAFSDGQMMPDLYAYHQENLNPPLEFWGIPSTAKSLALVVRDPDAPSGTFTHWLLWNMPVSTARIVEGSLPMGTTVGTNDFGDTRWDGPAPPNGTHHYVFTLYALDTTLNLPSTTKYADLERAMKQHILSQAETTGLYRAQ